MVADLRRCEFEEKMFFPKLEGEVCHEGYQGKANGVATTSGET